MKIRISKSRSYCCFNYSLSSTGWTAAASQPKLVRTFLPPWGSTRPWGSFIWPTTPWGTQASDCYASGWVILAANSGCSGERGSQALEEAVIWASLELGAKVNNWAHPHPPVWIDTWCRIQRRPYFAPWAILLPSCGCVTLENSLKSYSLLCQRRPGSSVRIWNDSAWPQIPSLSNFVDIFANASTS